MAKIRRAQKTGGLDGFELEDEELGFGNPMVAKIKS
jgi:hypothetical protein